ncbi:GNAT family N-acetyltransferase [Nocardia sp. NPDC050406]|uniref:GNAT family N-acetyltransferase n=1 Tax=Nocardia sp. NPDC050406 TaxID=3364318 RepID=UPI0037BC1285
MIRRATPADIPALVGLVHDLAEYEKAAEQCHLTEDQLRTALFGDSPAVFAHVAEGSEAEGVVGCAIWFRNFSTWEGVHGIFLEDLYVKPVARGRGFGKSLLVALAQEAVEQGYGRVDWSVLKWNTPSIDFYESIGAVDQNEWTNYRLTGDALAKLAAS